MGRIVRNIKVGPSPKWLVDYLESIGQRSINNVVDITNFILFDLGQPIHAFDLDKLASEKLIIRNAKVGESIELLGFENINGIQKRRNVLLSETNLVIADESGPVAIAGVKGGTKAEVDDNTKNILIEVANFDPISIRKTAKIFGIQTDAVKRYENGMTLNLCKDAMDEVSSLIYELCGDVIFEKIIDINNEKQSEKIVSFTTDYISKILGIEISNEEIENIFDNYNYRYTRNDNSWEFFVPDYRLDIDGGHDMAEEIGRAFGCERIIPKIPEFKSLIKDNEIWSKICIAKTKLINDGYREVMTYAFTNNGEVEIMASASDKNFLRTNLLDGLLKSYELNRLNMPFLGLSEIKIFEIGNVFKNNKEEIHIAYIDKKNKIEMTLDEFVKVDEQVLDNLNIELSENIKFKAWSIYPFITRDISVWVPQDTDPSLLANLYKELSVDLLVKDPELLDKFQKQDRISYSYRLVFQSYERTLKDEEVNQIMETITSKVKSLGFEPR
jgi:phenylalanyl-tRNA synthetase beta chain